MYDLTTFRSLCEQFLQKAIISNDQEDIKKYQRIKDFLSNDNCFVGARKIFVVFVLGNLGYGDQQIHEIYEYFNKVDMYEGTLEYMDNDGQMVQLDAFVNPQIENYYKFDTGSVFKYNTKDGSFYALIDGEWIYDGDIQRKFYDVGYDYSPVKCVIKSDSLRRK